MPPKVIVDPSFRRMAEIFTPNDEARLRRIADVVWGRDEPMPAEVGAAAREDVVAIVAANWRHGSVSDYPRLRAFLEVSGRFPDVDTIDYEACFQKGIRVLSCAPAFAPAVAEMALGLALAGARNIVEGDADIRAGREKFYQTGNADTFLLWDQPVGFIGFGGIARALKGLLAPFRCPIQVYDPWLTEGFLRTHGVTPVGLDTLLAGAKVIFVLAAPTEGNRALLDAAKLARIQQGALLVLVSRAHLVDFDALTEMLRANRFKAAIDVFPIEPLPADDPIRATPNTVLSAHRAGGDGQGYPLIGRMVVNDLEAILNGNPPQEMQAAQPELIRQRGACKV